MLTEYIRGGIVAHYGLNLRTPDLCTTRTDVQFSVYNLQRIYFERMNDLPYLREK